MAEQKCIKALQTQLLEAMEFVMNSTIFLNNDLTYM